MPGDHTDPTLGDAPDDTATTGDDPAEGTPPATTDVQQDPDEAAVLARLREALISSEPLVAPELVKAGSAAELEETFAKARAAGLRARDLTLARQTPRISSGAPGRATPAPASPFEKIRAGLQRRS